MGRGTPAREEGSETRGHTSWRYWWKSKRKKRFSRRLSWSAVDLSNAQCTPLKTTQSQKSLAAALTPCVDLTDIC